MRQECNFDDGDCSQRFSNASRDAIQPCNREVCSFFYQDGTVIDCASNCFYAGCDFSRFQCTAAKAVLEACPAFDAAAHASFTSEARLNFPDPSSMKGSIEVKAGTGFLGFGRCLLNGSTQLGCHAPREATSEPAYVPSAERGRVAVRLLGFTSPTQSCSSQPGVYSCAPALQWAWHEGNAQLFEAQNQIAAHVTFRIDSWGQYRGNLSVVVSSETFGIGLARAANSSSDAILSLRVGNSPFVNFPECTLRVGFWHRLAISFRLLSGEALSIVPTVVLNGSRVNIYHVLSVSPGFVLSLASDQGLAVGRDFPSATYLTDVYTLTDDAALYFDGTIAALRLWNSTSPGDVARDAGLNTSCDEDDQARAGLVACFDFNRTLKDSIQGVYLQLRAGDRYRPWCTTVDDGGHFMYHPEVNTLEVIDVGEHWGFCSPIQTLPSRGRDYNSAELFRVQSATTAELLASYTGCGRVPLLFRNNHASRHGGAIYDSTCDSAATVDDTCFLGMPSGLTPAYQILFASNSAGAAGGAVYLDSPFFSPICAAAFAQHLGLPIPHANGKVQFYGNIASAWGDNVATQPSGLNLLTGTRAYVPGTDQLDLVATLVDSLDQTVRGSSGFINPFLIKVLMCPRNDTCSDVDGLGPGSYYGCDQTGLCSTKTVSASSNVLCLANQSETTVVLSYSNLVLLPVPVRCLPCREGEHMQLQQVPARSPALLLKSCSACPVGTTVIDSNNPLYDCVPCPAGAVCPDGAWPIFGASTVDVTITIDLNNASSSVPDGLGLTLAAYLPTMLPLASQYVSVQSCPAGGSCSVSRRAALELGIAITLRVYLSADEVQKAVELSQSESWTRNLSRLLDKSGFQISVTAVQASIIATSQQLGEWLVVDGTYRLLSCPTGYLLINSTLEEQQCLECEAGTYSLDSKDGCIDGVCNQRACTECPSGASCARGSSVAWTHFVPRVLRSNLGPIPSVRLVLPNSTYTLFYMDSPDRYVWNNNSWLPSRSSDYQWEYVRSCYSATQPCDPASTQSFLLRICPPGTTQENTSRGVAVFNQALQECVPCAAGQYVVDPSQPPCIDCPAGGSCEAGVFQPRVPDSIWDEVNLLWRILSCPPGYIVVRSSTYTLVC